MLNVQRHVPQFLFNLHALQSWSSRIPRQVDDQGARRPSLTLSLPWFPWPLARILLSCSAVASSCAQGQETGPHEASWLSSFPFLSCPSFPACASAFPGVLLEKGLRPLQMCAAPSKHQLGVLLPPSYSHGTIVASADTSRSSTRAAPWMTRGPQGASGSTDIGWSCFFLSCRCPCFLPRPCFLRPETAFGDPARGPPRAAPHWSIEGPESEAFGPGSAARGSGDSDSDELDRDTRKLSLPFPFGIWLKQCTALSRANLKFET